ncbi:MAG: type II toxin-antitoxin system VapC family toxin [Armatimonadota bacterium]|nr:type II toxin-antitoxin system VapC family toxin [Armatimonadota bacterium]
MDSFVLDCSVALAWCFADESNAHAEAILDNLPEAQGLAPAIWPLEMANALLAAERRNRIAQAEAMQFLSLVRSLPIGVDTDVSEGAVDRAMFLARSENLSSYDASYLELAIRAGVPIATLDSGLAAAAKRLGVSLVIR